MDKVFVDELIQRYLIEFKKQDRSGVYGFTQRKLAYNSNRIEGSTLTEAQTASLFETRTISADSEIIRAKDIEEMSGHFSMFNHMLSTFDEPLSEDLIKSFHYYLKVGVFEDLANGYPCGEYKNRANVVSDIKVSSVVDVTTDMKAFIDQYNEKDIHTLYDLSLMHADYESIHPFQDGNGRTGRLILFRECLKNGISPVVIDSANKAEYNNALRSYQKDGIYDKLISFMEKEQKRFYLEIKDMIIPVQTIHKGKKSY